MKLWVTIFLILSNLSFAQASSVEQIIQEYDLQEIPTYKTTDSQLAAANALNKLFDKALYSESQHFSNATYWHKLEFPAHQDTTNKLYLTLNYHVIEYLDFYLFHGKDLISHWQRGAQQSWGLGDELYNGIIIPIELSANQITTLLIRKQGTSPLLTPIKLKNELAANTDARLQLLFWVAMLSSLVILIVHNVFVFLFLRYQGFIYYLGLNAILIVSLSIITGSGRLIFSESVSQWNFSHIFSIFGLGAWFLFRFSSSFLKDVQLPKPASYIRKYGDLLFITFLISCQLFDVKTIAIVFAAIEVFLFVFCVYLGVKSLSQRFVAARFYLFSWCILIIGSLINTMMYWKILPINLLTESALPICSILQLLGFSFAFVDKAKQVEQNRLLDSLTDSATGLPNRNFYFNQLEKQYQNSNGSQLNSALVIIEITSHEKLSHAFGPAKADFAMNELASNLDVKMNKLTDIMSLVLPNKSTHNVMRITVNKIAFVSLSPDSLSEQVKFIRGNLDSSALVNKALFRHQYKIGSALYPSQGTSLDRLYQNALIAGDHVKYLSESWLPFSDALNSNHAHQLNLITLLTEDIEKESLYFDIQPQVHLSTRMVVGGEVLVRWKNTKFGQIAPAEFIPLAEQSGLIHKLTEMVFHKAFQWAHQNPKALDEKTLSINISAQDLLQKDFAEKIIALGKLYSLPMNQIIIEVTETSVFENNDTVSGNINQFIDAGFRLSIDDFGIGYNSIQNLANIKVSELKIDQFFVINLLTDTSSKILCQNMLNLSRDMKINCVAEGIESEEVALLLQQWDCKIGQGYHLYKPMEVSQYLDLLD